MRDDRSKPAAGVLERNARRHDAAAEAILTLARYWEEHPSPMPVGTVLGIARHHRVQALMLRARAAGMRHKGPRKR
ncbi:hypothetical protein [Salinarimonas soli]|uniref:Uncharacterized protein n=1 Tax=Salinarimonas soli TaxID=1638099 RepID=A0A5B2VCA7_9HYPH|nr:hypothetical protein [Salinarimonas soli]KAA2236614.1 hypothetical protein F0L46_14190 [Salinarimonas soli]